MKKIISILLTFSIFVIVWFQSAMASFVMHDNMDLNDSSVGMQMNSDNCCEEMQNDCSTNKHECCYTPFKDSSNISNINIQISVKDKIKLKVIDYSFLAILNEELKINFIEKLTAPPKNNIIILNKYSELTGIIKSNC